MTDDEKRAAAGYGPKEAGAGSNGPFLVAASSSDAALKYNQNHDEAGLFSTADNAVPPKGGRGSSDGRVQVAQVARNPQLATDAPNPNMQLVGGNSSNSRGAPNYTELAPFV